MQFFAYIDDFIDEPQLCLILSDFSLIIKDDRVLYISHQMKHLLSNIDFSAGQLFLITADTVLYSLALLVN